MPEMPAAHKKPAKIIQIPALEDNYMYLIVCRKTGDAALIDPADATAASYAIEKEKVNLRLLINTHHHWDHVGANEVLKKRFTCDVAAAAADKGRIPGFSLPLQEDKPLCIGKLTSKVLSTPGHTSNHICLYFAAAKALFCGDTLFSVGCGRLFEGSTEQMVDSLYRKIGKLPDHTRVFCGHEYTEQNIAFARTLEPSNIALHEHGREVARLRHQGMATVPTELGLEKAINPFLRCGKSRELYQRAGAKMTNLKNRRIDIFAAVRRLKDNF